MICKNCGKEIDADSLCCPCCGEDVSALSDSYYNKESSNADRSYRKVRWKIIIPFLIFLMIIRGRRHIWPPVWPESGNAPLP